MSDAALVVHGKTLHACLWATNAELMQGYSNLVGLLANNARFASFSGRSPRCSQTRHFHHTMEQSTHFLDLKAITDR